MNTCPCCGAKAQLSSKVQSFKIKTDSKISETLASKIVFKCLSCGTLFEKLSSLPVQANTIQAGNVKNNAQQIIHIQGALMQTIKNLKEKIAALETEKSNLMNEIEELRKSAETHVIALESEVNQMREDAKLLREFIEKPDSAVSISPQNSSNPN
ncbi:MAG: hypothetical protein GX638_13660 [Crenarchaeota archaeon]|nr:hypothetical protein [Thermoproteota archaeon]